MRVRARLFIGLIVFSVAALGVMQWNFQRKILGQVAQIQTAIAGNIDQVAQLKTAVAARPESIPPLFGGKHVELRKHFILDHISQAEGSFLLLVGDSIVEGIDFPRVGTKRVINGGIGGAGLNDVFDLLLRTRDAKYVSGVLIAIGVNDSIRGEVPDDFFVTWAKKYEQTILLAKQLSGNKVAVLTILPVEKDKSLGDQYFSMDKIQALNRIISTLANKHRVMLIDQYAVFRPLYEANKPFTTDGVHLNVSAYRLMKATLRKATVAW